MWRRLAVIGVQALFAGPCLANEIELLRVGSWQFGAYDDHETRKFSHCSADHAFDQAVLIFTMTGDGALSVTLVDPALRFQPGKAIPVDLAVDPGPPARLSGVAAAGDAVAARLPEDVIAAMQYRREGRIHAVFPGSRYDFDLGSPSGLLWGLKDCVARNHGATAVDDAVTRDVPEKPYLELLMLAPLPTLPAPDNSSSGSGASKVQSQADSTRELNSKETAPDFVPWPPPMPTASYAYPPDWIRKHRTIGDLSAGVEDVLRKSGYTQFSYTTVPGGFALATQFERVDQIETPMADLTRWAPLAKDVPKTWLEAMKSLFVGRQGRCRLFVFFLTTDDRPPSKEEPTINEARNWSLGGTPTLQPDLVDVLLTPKHRFYVYEYEFVEESSDDIVKAPASSLPLDQQLKIVKLLP